MVVPGGSQAMIQAAEELGFTGIDLNQFGVFPVISLKNDQFQSSDGAIRLGEEFYCRVLGGRDKYVYKTDLPERDPRNELFYSFDGVYATNGELVEDKLANWKQLGFSHYRKDYIDLNIVATVDGLEQMFILSVPPTSKASYTGLVLKFINLVNRGGSKEEVMVKVWKGPLVTKVKFPFHPIKFDLVEQR